MPRKLYLLLACMMLVAVGTTPAMADHGEGHTFTFSSLNGSSAQGDGTVEFGENGVTVSVEASGLEPNQVHELHIHGIESQDVSCPTDTDGDGMVSHEESKQQVGGHLLNLKPYPTADANGNINFEQTYTEGVDDLAPIENRVVMAHGITMNGEYMPDMSVACGEITPAGASTTPPSMPETGGMSFGLIHPLVGIGALVVGATALVLIRRSF